MPKGVCEPTGTLCWSSPFLSPVGWERTTLEQFGKSCSPWEGPTREKSMENYLPWEGPHSLHCSPGGGREWSKVEPGRKEGMGRRYFNTGDLFLITVLWFDWQYIQLISPSRVCFTHEGTCWVMSLSLYQPELFIVLSLPCPAEEGQWHSGNPPQPHPLRQLMIVLPQSKSPGTNNKQFSFGSNLPHIHIIIFLLKAGEVMKIPNQGSGRNSTDHLSSKPRTHWTILWNCTENLVLALSFCLFS